MTRDSHKHRRRFSSTPRAGCATPTSSRTIFGSIALKTRKPCREKHWRRTWILHFSVSICTNSRFFGAIGLVWRNRLLGPQESQEWRTFFWLSKLIPRRTRVELKNAREFTRQAVASAMRVGAKETAACYEAAASIRESLFGNFTDALQRVEAGRTLSTSRDVTFAAALALASLERRHSRRSLPRNWQTVFHKTQS